MQFMVNPFRGHGMTMEDDCPEISVNFQSVESLLKHCPVAAITPLTDRPDLAAQLGIGQLLLKDERTRMRLGSFKATGAAYVIAKAACDVIARTPSMNLDSISREQLKQTLKDQTYICASAGNHGLSVAAAAAVFGAKAVIYLASTVPQKFADSLTGYGAEVVRSGDDYEQSIQQAIIRAEAEGWSLLADTSWPGYSDIPLQIMEGYLVVAAEICQQLQDQSAPDYIVLQAGVGGLAAAVTAYVRQNWGEQPSIVIVEPQAAPALFASIAAGKLVTSQGPASCMGRLDCKEASLVALQCLAKYADWFVTIDDKDAEQCTDWLNQYGISSTPSGCAGLAAVRQSLVYDNFRHKLGLTADSRVLAIITEKA